MIMSLSLDSTIKEIRSNPEAARQIEELIPGFSTSPQMKLVGKMTFKKLAKIQPAKVTPEMLAHIERILLFLD
jgi:hypothetical protein